MSVGRDRRSGHRRSRPATPGDAQPSPFAFKREATELAAVLSIVVVAYGREYEAGWPPGGEGLGIQGGMTNATETAFAAPEQKASREACRRAAEAVRQAKVAMKSVAKELTTGEMQQERPSPDAVVDRHEFETARVRAEHMARERELDANTRPSR